MTNLPTCLACVLFDLDGTLLDTAPDMGAALNALLLEQGREELSAEQIRPEVSHGSLGLIKLAFDIGPEDEQFIPLRDRFLALYQANVAQYTQLFDGMEQVLQTLEQSLIPWGIVTNKPGYLTTELLLRLNLSERVSCVVAGDTLPLRKPDPAPLLHACQQLDVAPQQSIYIGDAERDIEAARRAEMPSLIAAYGYISAQDTLADWGAQGIVEHASEIIDWLNDATWRAA